MPTQTLSFPGAGGDTLDARLEMPEGEPLAFAVFAHCFTCGKDSVAAVRVSRGLAARGIAVLRFDFAGLGNSGGAFGDSNFSSNVLDIAAAAAFLRQTRRAPSLLVGHSLGGAAVLAAAHLIGEARAVATIGAPSDVGHVAHVFGEAVAQIEAQGTAQVVLGGRSFAVQRQLLDDLRAVRLEEHVAGLHRALLVLHAPRDEVVGIEHANRLFLAARHPRSFVSLDSADHYLHRKTDGDYAAAVIAAWAQRYLPAAA